MHFFYIVVDGEIFMPRVIYFEVHADNPGRAILFYQAVFGWEFKQWNPHVDYWLITTGRDDEPGIDGGLMQRRMLINGEAVIAYVCTIRVPNLDDYLGKVAKQGGGIAMQKMAVPGVGWLAYCHDTEGNLFGMMENDEGAK